jgi:hypothetical protein
MQDQPFRDAIRNGLSSITLPSTTRPSVREFEAPTEELVIWGAQTYAYSSIAHIRNVFSGLEQLLDAGNEATAILVFRHIYEWTMHSAYTQQQYSVLIPTRNWADAWDLFLQVDTGNSWIKKHGSGYVPQNVLDEIPAQLRIKKLVAAYESHQRKWYGESDVQDIYGLLSEHSHPNGACFLSYRRIEANSLIFDGSGPILMPSPIPPIIDWLLCINEILGLSGEKLISVNLTSLLTGIALIEKRHNT